MTDEGRDETTDDETPDASDAAPAQDAPDAEADAAPAQEAPAPDPPAGEEQPPEPPEQPAAEVAPPAEQLPPKERRRRERSTHSGEAGAPRSIEDRAAERAQRRARNASDRRGWRRKSREQRRADGPREGTPPAERRGTGSPRVRQGVVISDKGDKTITVRIDTARQHRTYGKIVRSTTTLHAHDERNEAGAGDTVRVVESRPLSRTKRWRLVEIVDRAR